jgi:hypothetical protein
MGYKTAANMPQFPPNQAKSDGICPRKKEYDTKHGALRLYITARLEVVKRKTAARSSPFSGDDGRAEKVRSPGRERRCPGGENQSP